MKFLILKVIRMLIINHLFIDIQSIALQNNSYIQISYNSQYLAIVNGFAQLVPSNTLSYPLKISYYQSLGFFVIRDLLSINYCLDAKQGGDYTETQAKLQTHSSNYGWFQQFIFYNGQLCVNSSNQYLCINNQTNGVYMSLGTTQNWTISYKVCHRTCTDCNFDGTCISCKSIANMNNLINWNRCFCWDGYYEPLGVQVFVCLSCNLTLCKTCINQDFHCTSCNSGSQRQFNLATNTCDCLDGFYDNGTLVCQKCIHNCKQCKDRASNCTTCEVNLTFRQDHSLINNSCPCVQGYLDIGLQTCQKCSYQCLTCGLSVDHCLSCNTSNTFRQDQTSIQFNCTCVAGYYDDGNVICQQCDQTCMECSRYSYNCTKCDSEKLQRQIQLNSCFCQPGYFAIQMVTNCQVCHYSCLTCSSHNSCDSCPSQQITNRQDLSNKNHSCPCKEGYTDEGEQSCKICEKNCLSCDSIISGYCLSCHGSKRNLKEKGCPCLLGYYQSDASTDCQICDTSCSECVGKGTFCIKCDISARLTPQNKCSCFDGYYMKEDNDQCTGIMQKLLKACDKLCQTCDSENLCLSCDISKNRVLSAGHCICAIGFNEQQQELICISGYVFFSNISNLNLKSSEKVAISSMVSCSQKSNQTKILLPLKIFQYFGLLSFFVNTQAIYQMRYLNFTPPINVYLTEFVLGQINFPKGLPDYDQFFGGSVVSNYLFFFIEYNNLEPYRRAKNSFSYYGFSSQFLLNTYLQMSVMVLITVLVIAKQSNREVRQNMEDIDILKKYLTYFDVKDVGQIAQVGQFVQSFAKLYSNNWLRFLLVYLESSFCICLLSLFLQIESTLVTSFSLISLILGIIYSMILFYASYRCIQICIMYQFIFQRILLLRQYEPYLISAIHYQTQLNNILNSVMGSYYHDRKVETKIQLYFWLISFIKKILFAVIIVFLQGQVIQQLTYLLTINFLVTFLKVSQKFYSYGCQLLVLIQEIIFFAFLILKMREYQTYVQIRDTVQDSDKLYIQWIQDGWLIVILELVMVALMLLVSIARLVTCISNGLQNIYSKRKVNQRDQQTHLEDQAETGFELQIVSLRTDMKKV